jgi:hypothetical protein
MKNIIFILLFCKCLFVNQQISAQIQLPWPTTTAKSETMVGLTTISLDYSRPSKYGRDIFGALVPYDTLWRTGANKNSLITFSDDVIIGGTELKKGTYSIFSKPGKTIWEVYFYTETDIMGIPKEWKIDKIAAKVSIIPQKISITETFSINIDNITYESCKLEIKWDDICVPIKIEVPTDKKVSANIEKVLNGPDAYDYINAAIHCRRAKKDLNQAMIWMNKSLEMGLDDFWAYRQKSLLEADMKDYKAAINSANISIKKATEAGNFEYVKMNKVSVADWSKL